ncbi:hypothetical protein ACFL7E_02760 [Thermodesulfobacteriota bacterium]
MGIIQKLKSIQETFDKYIMASMYGEAGAPHLARELFKDQERPRKSKRPQTRKRPRPEMRPPR